ncbi:MAG: ATP-binding protein [Chloroflexota bacterium]
MRVLAIPSLRWRLVVIMCMAYIVVAVATEIVGYNQQSANLHRQLESRARSDSVILAAGSVASLRTARAGDVITLRNFLNSLTHAQGVSYAAVFGGNGCLVASTRPRRPPACLPAPAAFTPTSSPLASGDVKGMAPVADEGTDLGFAMVILSGASVQHDLRNVLASDLLLRSIGLIIFLALTLAIAQYILGPLTFLAKSADSIRHGRLDTRVPPGGHTELATVADAFNDMATALEQRIKHLSFLASTAPILPTTFRDHGDIAPTLRAFCDQLDTLGAGLLPSETRAKPEIWYDATPGDSSWRKTVVSIDEARRGPALASRNGSSVMVVPVLGDTVFVTARNSDKPFSREEQQVITNFAYQIGVAADNAQLFESQQEALQVKDQFLSIVSHELRTPLTTIKGYAQMLRRKLTNDPDDQRFAVNIDTQVGRLGRLVDDLLDVTRFSRGEFELKRQQVDLRTLLEDVAIRFRIISPQHTYRLNLDGGNLEGYWDRDRLEQVMNNLVGNAIKYSPPGGTVTLLTRREGGDVVVGVRDEGEGIPEEDQRHLFERFYRGNAEGGNITGLGLGLYVTQRIVEAHGGHVGVRSRVHEGSEFFFNLPAARSPAGIGEHA